MTALRKYLADNKIDLMKLDPNPDPKAKILIQLYTRRSKAIEPGGGLRGVIATVGRFDPESKFMGKNVYLIVDLMGVVIEAWHKTWDLPV